MIKSIIILLIISIFLFSRADRESKGEEEAEEIIHPTECPPSKNREYVRMVCGSSCSRTCPEGRFKIKLNDVTLGSCVCHTLKSLAKSIENRDTDLVDEIKNFLLVSSPEKIVNTIGNHHLVDAVLETLKDSYLDDQDIDV